MDSRAICFGPAQRQACPGCRSLSENALLCSSCQLASFPPSVMEIEPIVPQQNSDCTSGDCESYERPTGEIHVFRSDPRYSAESLHPSRIPSGTRSRVVEWTVRSLQGRIALLRSPRRTATPPRSPVRTGSIESRETRKRALSARDPPAISETYVTSLKVDPATDAPNRRSACRRPLHPRASPERLPASGPPESWHHCSSVSLSSCRRRCTSASKHLEPSSPSAR